MNSGSCDDKLYKKLDDLFPLYMKSALYIHLQHHLGGDHLLGFYTFLYNMDIKIEHNLIEDWIERDLIEAWAKTSYVYQFYGEL